MYIHIYIYICIYICIYIHTHTHTHTQYWEHSYCLKTALNTVTDGGSQLTALTFLTALTVLTAFTLLTALTVLTVVGKANGIHLRVSQRSGQRYQPIGCKNMH